MRSLLHDMAIHAFQQRRMYLKLYKVRPFWLKMAVCQASHFKKLPFSITLNFETRHSISSTLFLRYT